MNMDIARHTLRCKEELDRIIQISESLQLMLYNQELSEMYQDTLRELRELLSVAEKAIELLNYDFERYAHRL